MASLEDNYKIIWLSERKAEASRTVANEGRFLARVGIVFGVPLLIAMMTPLMDRFPYIFFSLATADLTTILIAIILTMRATHMITRALKMLKEISYD